MAKKKQEEHAQAQEEIREVAEEVEGSPEEALAAVPAEASEKGEGEISFPIVGIGASAGAGRL